MGNKSSEGPDTDGVEGYSPIFITNLDLLPHYYLPGVRLKQSRKLSLTVMRGNGQAFSLIRVMLKIPLLMNELLCLIDL